MSTNDLEAIVKEQQHLEVNETVWNTLNEELEPLRQQLLEHSLYQHLDSPRAIRIFMEHHCYSVVDFMCLLKSLQSRLTVVSVPWFPPANVDAARFINEIVVAEESDEAPGGGFISHYELYLQAMEEAEAETRPVREFIELIRNRQHYRRALRYAGVPTPAQHFVKATMELCLSGKNHEVASYFVFGRENLIPDMFPKILTGLNQQEEISLDTLIYYVNRHIEIDGEEHGPAAQNMLFHLCDHDPRRWRQVSTAAKRALAERIRFWDGVEKTILSQSEA